MVGPRVILLLDPTAEDEPEQSALTSRLSSLQGKRVGLLDNTHRNVDIYMEEAERILKEEYGVAEVVYLRKANANSAAAPAILKEMVSRADAVVHAVAD
jgi:hypothetical protein